MSSKRFFDLAFCFLLAPVWVPALIFSSCAVLLFSGLPIFYVSNRRVFGKQSARVWKLRTMVRDAEKIANRTTIPVTEQRFLNIDLQSPLYTGVGRIIERFNLTELPQFMHVLAGSMHVIGNRPLPEDVVETLVAEFPDAEDRFAIRCGLTGPVQLIGRQHISDVERLMLETTYARSCLENYVLWLDIMLAFNTVLVLLGVRRGFTVNELSSAMRRWGVSVPLPGG